MCEQSAHDTSDNMYDWHAQLADVPDIAPILRPQLLAQGVDPYELTVAEDVIARLDPFTRAHSYRASVIGLTVTRAVNPHVPPGLRPDPTETALAALLHDNGKGDPRVAWVVKASVLRPDEPYGMDKVQAMGPHSLYGTLTLAAAGLQRFIGPVGHHHALQEFNPVCHRELAPLTPLERRIRDDLTCSDVVEAVNRNNVRTAGKTELQRMQMARRHFEHVYGDYPNKDTFLEPTLEAAWETYKNLRD